MKKKFNPQVSYFYDEKNPTIKRIVDGQPKEVANYPTTYETCIADPRHHKHYSVLNHISLYNILSGLKRANKDIKGAAGSMFFFIDPEYTYHTKENMVSRGVYTSIGICGIDLDDMPEELAEKINFNFWLYSSKMPQLYASYISHSKKGVHIIVRCKSGLNQYEYIVEDLKQTLEFVRVVKEVDNIDLTRYIDTSSTSMSQRHHLSYCKYVPINEEAEEIELPTQDKIDIDIKEEYTEKQKSHLRSCIKKYDNAIYNIQHPTNESKQLGKSIKEFSSEYQPQEFVLQTVNDVNDVVYLTYEQRWLLFSSLYKIFQDKQDYLREAERICKMLHGRENHPWTYYYDQAKRLLNGKLADGISVKYLNLFGYNVKNKKLYELEQTEKNLQLKDEEKKQYIIEQRKNCLSSMTPSADKIKIQGRYLGDIEEDIIMKRIKDCNGYLILKSGTDTGKTTRITEIANKYNGIVGSPFKVLNFQYGRKLHLVSSNNEYEPSLGCCMTYDRLASIDYRKIHNKLIFIDEEHVLFRDRTYRKALRKLMKTLPLLVQQGCKIIFVSATPINIFNAETLEFYQDRPYVRVIPVKVVSTAKNKTESAERFIRKRLLETDGFNGLYDRKVLFSNTSTRRLYDSLCIAYNDIVDIMHRQYEKETACIMTDNMLKKKNTLCTSIAYNGVNFLNKDEFISVLSVVEEETTAIDIIQQCGRCRQSIVDVYLIYNEYNEEEQLYEDKNGNFLKENVKQKKLRHKIRVDVGITEKDNIGEDKYEALQELEDYLKNRTGVKNIIEDLNKEEYFYIADTITVASAPSKKENVLRTAADNYIKENFTDEMIDPTFYAGADIDAVNRYVKDICRDINRFFTDELYYISWEDFYAAIRDINVHVRSFLQSLREIKKAISFTESDFSMMELKLDNIARRLFEDNDENISAGAKKIILKSIRSEINHFRNLYDQYKNLNDLEIIHKCVNIMKDKQLKKQKGNSIGGKKGKQIEVIIDGVSTIYDTKKQAAEKIGYSVMTIDNIIKGKRKTRKNIIIKEL